MYNDHFRFSEHSFHTHSFPILSAVHKTGGLSINCIYVLSVYSNSGADEIILTLSSTHLCHFVFIFSGFYLIFFSRQIIRSKIESDKAIFSILISPIFIVISGCYHSSVQGLFFKSLSSSVKKLKKHPLSNASS